MATILSLPVRQQQDSSKSNIVTSKFPKHFGVKIRINRMKYMIEPTLNDVCHYHLHCYYQLLSTILGATAP
ncbi:unnamed protein product [Rotaria magnacalcarata]